VKIMYDLIVVGAGPAGTSAARTAAQHGFATLLLEKERVPRNKLCGGGVTPKVMNLMDFTFPKELVEREARAARIHVGGTLYHFESAQPLVYMTSRTKFDSFLAAKAADAGAEVKDRSPVRAIEVTKSHVEVRTSTERFTSKILIGADGTGGPTARTAGFYHSWRSDEVSYAIESEVSVGESAVQDFVGGPSYFDLHFGVSPAGYGWVFPKDDHLTVGVGCRLSKLRDGMGLFKAFAKRVSALEGFDVPRPQAHLIPLGGAASVASVRERVLLAGDSAAFVEPLLGEGIYFSIRGGQIGAEVAAEAIHEEKYTPKFLARYERRCREAFGIDFDVAYRIASMTYLEQDDMERAARFFFDEKTFQQCMIGLMDGRIRYRDAKVRLAWPYFKYCVARFGSRFHL
jgi:geranylgeranyl reductase family protein